EDALCSPDDAAGALQAASNRGDQEPGALADGAQRVGVSLALVVETLTEHIKKVLAVLVRWRSGTYELVLDGFPEGALDRDSAPARSFLLDTGLVVSDALAAPTFRPFPETPPRGFPAASPPASLGPAVDPKTLDWDVPDAA